jgi:predicted DNA-binding transcriptional regulator AlpA
MSKQYDKLLIAKEMHRMTQNGLSLNIKDFSEAYKITKEQVVSLAVELDLQKFLIETKIIEPKPKLIKDLYVYSLIKKMINNNIRSINVADFVKKNGTTRETVYNTIKKYKLEDLIKIETKANLKYEELKKEVEKLGNGDMQLGLDIYCENKKINYMNKRFIRIKLGIPLRPRTRKPRYIPTGNKVGKPATTIKIREVKTTREEKKLLVYKDRIAYFEKIKELQEKGLKLNEIQKRLGITRQDIYKSYYRLAVMFPNVCILAKPIKGRPPEPMSKRQKKIKKTE